MDARLRSWLEEALAPQPCPVGMTSRDIVRRAIEFRDPPRVPYSFVDPVRSDFFETAALEWRRKTLDSGSSAVKVGQVYRDEWGVRQQVSGSRFDRILDHPLEDLSCLEAYRVPDLASPERFVWLEPLLHEARAAGKYVVAADPVLLYERMRELMGFETLMVAQYTQRDGLELLLDRLTELTVGVIDQLARLGDVDAFMTWQDFGLQTRLPMKLETFRELYKPRLARIARAASKHEMHFIWHCCGQIFELIPEMISIGVDVLQLDQPRLMGHQGLAEAFGGKICFWNTVDIQWAAGDCSSEGDLRAEVAAMMQPFKGFKGGFIARHYPYPQDIGLSPAFHESSASAFFENGCALKSDRAAAAP